MDKYRKVLPQNSKPADNEVRVSSRSIISGVITYIQNTFKDQNFKTMEITATSTAIDKAVKIALYLRKRSKGMSLITKISCLKTKDVYEPIEEGLDIVEVERKIPAIKIIASFQAQDSKDPGYLAPLPENEIQTNYTRPEREGPQRGRFRRGRGRGRFGSRRNYRGYNRNYDDNEKREGGYNDRREGGYNDRREGGYNDRREGGYNDRREGGFYSERRGGRFRRRRPQGSRYRGYSQRHDKQ